MFAFRSQAKRRRLMRRTAEVSRTKIWDEVEVVSFFTGILLLNICGGGKTVKQLEETPKRPKKNYPLYWG